VRCSSLVAQARFRFGESSVRAHEAARHFLEEHEISHLSEQLTSRVSGGELQRVLIAALDAQECPILLVDEPANHLDPQHQVAAYQRLGRLWQRKNKTLVIVSHDLRLAQLLGPAAQVRVLGIKNAQIVEDLQLNAPDLHLHLEQIYGLPFVPLDQAGGLSVRLEYGAPSDLATLSKGDS
jgi:iron complex transport system ATP-binding protein